MLPEKVMRRLEKLLRPFFDKYDDDKSGQLDKMEFWSVFHDLKEHVQTQVRDCGEKASHIIHVIALSRSALAAFHAFQSQAVDLLILVERWFYGTCILLCLSCCLQELNAIFEKIDTDQSGLVDFDEFVTGVVKFLLEKSPDNVVR